MKTMPFGRHKGKPLSALPHDYLAWLHEQIELREPLRSAVAREVDRRFPLTGKQPAPEVRHTAKEIINMGYRALALRRHPDHQGGSHQQMLALSEAKEWLESIAS